jgi:hypothetical protein
MGYARWREILSVFCVTSYKHHVNSDRTTARCHRAVISFSTVEDSSVMPVSGAKGGVNGNYYLHSLMAKSLLGYISFLAKKKIRFRLIF